MIVRYADGAPVRLRDVGTVGGRACRRPPGRALQRHTDRRHRHRQGQQLQHVKLVDDVAPRSTARSSRSCPAGLALKVSIDDSAPIRKIVAALEATCSRARSSRAWWCVVLPAQLPLHADHLTAIPMSLARRHRDDVLPRYTFNQMSLLGLLLLIGVVVGRRDRGAPKRVSPREEDRRSTGAPPPSRAPSRSASR